MDFAEVEKAPHTCGIHRIAPKNGDYITDLYYHFVLRLLHKDMYPIKIKLFS